jgi:hypothetical protein
MAKFQLIPFTSYKNLSFEFDAEINQNNDAFYISFLMHGDLSLIDFDNPTPKKNRTIKLWEKTCFELFIKNSKDEYLEFNFSPSFEWNCFYFKQKGAPLCEWEKMQRPETDILLSLESFFLVAEIKKKFLPPEFMTQEMSVGISSVVKMKDGQINYWALSHKDSRPNFHHFDSFICKF